MKVTVHGRVKEDVEQLRPELQNSTLPEVETEEQNTQKINSKKGRAKTPQQGQKRVVNMEMLKKSW